MRILIMIILAITVLASCQPANKPPANEAAPDPDQPVQEIEQAEQTAPQDQKDQGAQTTARRLAKLAVQVPDVEDATAVVAGKTAVVGIDVNASLDRSRVGTTKYSVAEALKEDPQGAQTYVTADVDIVQRLKEISQQIQNGRPAAGFADELAAIVGRIMPQGPKNVEQQEQPAEGTNEQRMDQNPRSQEGGNQKHKPVPNR